MTFALSALRATAERRLPGYLERALELGTPLGGDQYDFSSEAMTELATYRKPIGLGDAAKAIIHAGVNVLPLSDQTKTAIKECVPCGKRAARWNEIIPNIGIKQD